MPGVLDRIPGGYPLFAAMVAMRRRVSLEWRASPPARLFAPPEPEGLGARPRDLRPADPEAGRRILAGAFVFNGEALAIGPRGDPWDRPSPSRRFAAALHGFGWMRDLTAHGDPGAWEALRLTLAWRRLFGRWNVFAWSGAVLERRVFNLACGLAAMTGPASDAEAEQIEGDLAHQAYQLLASTEGPARAAERAAAAAMAGAALGGEGGARLLGRALRRLSSALTQTVEPDGGHASRSPQAALELLLDLCSLEDALTQLGHAPPDEMARAIDRLAGAVQFFTLGDGRLMAFQGGEAPAPDYVAAAGAVEIANAADGRAPPFTRNGYHRLASATLEAVMDARSPAPGAWSETACAQPLAIEVLTHGKRLFVGSGWSPNAAGPAALRLVDAASTAAVGEGACGEPLQGFPAEVLGPRLGDAYAVTDVRRQEARGALWLEASHDGWVARHGLRHDRRLYLDVTANELRGEDTLTPLKARGGLEGRRFVPFTVRFHLHPQVSALVAQDRRSVLLKIEGQPTGWWLRNDALEVALEPSAFHEDGLSRHSQQIVLRGQARLDAGARVRWKLSAASDRANPSDSVDGQEP